ncbi:MAG: hypothetical protein NT062_32055 [Proteobacteria bacterium]|nr:hypothetical protein [Pseudomonadota bacterium]
MKLPRIVRGRPSKSLLRVSVILTLLGLVLMAWSILAPTPMPVMLAMTVGQGFGTLAFGLFVFVVLRDLRQSGAAERVAREADAAEQAEPEAAEDGA